MSVREEDKQKGCSGRGLGLAAAAIGVGVGAALYYYFSKRPESENPDSEGSTSQGWRCEQPQALRETSPHTPAGSNDSYITISENSTTDTSINEILNLTEHNNIEVISLDFDSDESMISNDDSTSDRRSLNDSSFSFQSENNNTHDSNSDFVLSDADISVSSFSDDSETGYISRMYRSTSFTSDTENTDIHSTDWDVTNSSLDVPSVSTPNPLENILNRFVNFVSPRQKPSSEEEQIRILQEQALLSEEEQIRTREQAFRQRSWSLEECSICFEIMLKDQELMALPCTHNFHVTCIGPWLQEQTTCPVCRKPAQ